LIGTKKIYKYQYNTSSIELNTKYQVELIMINIDVISSSSSSDNIYVYSYQNETTTDLAKYIVTRYNFNKMFNITLPVKQLYNVTEISQAIDNENSFLIFSYNKKNKEDFYFYYFDYKNSDNVKLISFGNKYNFVYFRDAIF
jgi:hypothetical protein